MHTHLVKCRTAVGLVTAIALVAWANAAPAASAAARANGSAAILAQVAPPSGPPAPPGFAETLKRIYGQAVSYAGLPGKGVDGKPLVTAAPMSTAAFAELVGGLTPDQLAQLYDRGPDEWARIDAAVGTYTEKAPPSAVASKIAEAYAATPRPNPTAAPALAGAAADFTPAEPESYTDANCPIVILGPDDGYALMFGYYAAAHIASILAQPAYAFEAVTYTIVAVLMTVASALKIPAMTIELLINSGTFCFTNNQVDELYVMNRNAVALNDTSIALLALDEQIKTLKGQVKQLLETRTDAVVSKLNTAQASLDKAQRHAIEKSLQGGLPTAVASYELPASLGGYLDSTPIGVKAIVTDAIDSLKRANQSVNPTAEKHFSQGNTALDAGQYKQAFFYYQSAYQGLTK
jgi:hypothetical protein